MAGRPIHNIQSRMKKKKSLEDKLRKKDKEPTVMNAKDYLQDIAGVRVICYFVDDIYNLVDALKRQADLIVVRERDYIREPKPNGYRSYGNSCLLLGRHGVFSGGDSVSHHVDGFLGKHGAPDFI